VGIRILPLYNPLSLLPYLTQGSSGFWISSAHLGSCLPYLVPWKLEQSTRERKKKLKERRKEKRRGGMEREKQREI
jgi:hypothetical protein